MSDHHYDRIPEGIVPTAYDVVEQSNQSLGLRIYNQAQSLGNLEVAVAKLAAATAIDSSERTRKMHAVVGAMHNVGEAIDVAQQYLDLKDIAEAVAPAYHLHSQAPFVERLQTWPRGYVGDFETIEILMEGRSSLDESHPAYWIDWFALNMPVACQHRNKLAFQSAEIRRDLPDTASVLSVGCGGGRDLATLADFKGSSLSFCLIDIEEDALNLASDRLEWAADVEVICGDAVRALRKMDTQFDRIVFGGLFDYLSDKTIILLLKLARTRLLKKGGRIVFTNLSTNNPFAVWLENMAAWKMIYRDANALALLAKKAGIRDGELSIEFDPTGLSQLCVVEER